MINQNRGNAFRGNVNKTRYKRGGTTYFTPQMGEITPHLFRFVTPNESFSISQNHITRMQPTTLLPMTEIYEETKYFFCPARLLYRDFDKVFMGGVDYTSDSYQIPRIGFNSGLEFRQFWTEYGLLYSFFGLPYDRNLRYPNGTNLAENYPPYVSLLPIRFYLRMYWEHFFIKTGYTPAELDAFKAKFIFDGAAVRTLATFRANEGYYLKNLRGFEAGEGWNNFNKRGFFEVMFTGDYFSKILKTVNKVTTSIGIGSTLNDLKTGYNLARWYQGLIDSGRDIYNYSMRTFGVAANLGYTESQYLGGTSNMISFVEITSQVNDSTNAIAMGEQVARGIAKTDGGVLSFTPKEHGFVMGVKYYHVKPVTIRGMDRVLSWVDTMDIPHLEFAGNFYQDIKHSDVVPYGGGSIIGFTAPYNDFRFEFDVVSGAFNDTLKAFLPLRQQASVDAFKIGTLFDIALPSSPTNPIDNWWCFLFTAGAVPSEPLFYVKAYTSFDVLSPLPQVPNNLNLL